MRLRLLELHELDKNFHKIRIKDLIRDYEEIAKVIDYQILPHIPKIV